MVEFMRKLGRKANIRVQTLDSWSSDSSKKPCIKDTPLEPIFKINSTQAKIIVNNFGSVYEFDL